MPCHTTTWKPARPCSARVGVSGRVFSRAGDRLGEFRAELTTNGRDVDADLLEHLAGHLPANAAAAGRPVMVGAVPGGVGEGGVGASLALDRLEFVADAGAKGLEPLAGRELILIKLHGVAR